MGLDERINRLEKDIGIILERVKNIAERVNYIRGHMVTKELFEARIETLATRVEGVDRRIDDWRNATKLYFTILSIIVAIVGIAVPILLKLLLFDCSVI